MNWEALGAIAEMIGGVAVLFTLIYLAIQVRQGTAVSREAILRNQTDRNMDNSKFIAGTPGLMDIYIRAMDDPDPEHPLFRRSNYPPSDEGVEDVYAQSPYRPRMRTAPLVNRAYRQDEFPNLKSRLPRDAQGRILPPVAFTLDGRRVEHPWPPVNPNTKAGR